MHVGVELGCMLLVKWVVVHVGVELGCMPAADSSVLREVTRLVAQ